jgi:hypothetical protein
VPIEVPSTQPREFLVEVYGPLFAALGRLSLPSPVRLSDFINDRDGFLRLTDVEFLPNGGFSTAKRATGIAEYLINKTGIELICQPTEVSADKPAGREPDHGRLLWQAFSQMAGSINTDLHVAKERYQVQVHTHRFIVSAQLHLAHGAAPEAMLSHLPNKFVPVTDATARFVNPKNESVVIERKLMLVNRDHILLVELDESQRRRPAA